MPTSAELIGRARNLAGMRFGMLSVDDHWIRKPEGKRVRIHWRCQCDCGNIIFVSQNFLSTGHKRSCGCLLGIISKKNLTTHGMTGSPAHRSWLAMRRRCLQPKDPNYPNYGGRGITICERWSSFENFIADMGERPDGYSIERIDVNGNYDPSNCKWIPRGEQSFNRRTTVRFKANGETKMMSDWSRDASISPGCLSNRILRGWDPQEAIDRPVGTAKRRSKMYSYKGRTQHLSAWVEELGVCQSVLWRRLKRGWTIEDAFSTPPRKITRRVTV